MKKLIFILILLVGFTACDKSSTEPTGEKLTEMAGTNWYVKNVHFIDGSIKSINEIIGADEGFLLNNYSLRFTTDSEIRGSAGCNAVKYMYKLDGDKIQLDFYGGMTYALCPFTSEFPAVLGQKNIYGATENSLFIGSTFEDYAGLEFVRDRSSEFQLENLINYKWKLFQFYVQEGAKVPFQFGYNGDDNRTDTIPYELEFLADGTIKGLANCNTFDGKYELDNTKITISPDNVTEIACLYSDEYLKILNKSTYVYIAGNQLIIYSNLDGYKALVFHREE